MVSTYKGASFSIGMADEDVRYCLRVALTEQTGGSVCCLLGKGQQGQSPPAAACTDLSCSLTEWIDGLGVGSSSETFQQTKTF